MSGFQPEGIHVTPWRFAHRHWEVLISYQTGGGLSSDAEICHIAPLWPTAPPTSRCLLWCGAVLGALRPAAPLGPLLSKLKPSALPAARYVALQPPRRALQAPPIIRALCPGW